MKKLPKKNVMAVLAGVAVAVAVTASAATLGGLDTQHLGANSTEVVAPVTKGVSVTWDTRYDATAKHYVVDDFDLTAGGGQTIPADAEVRITLTGENGASLGEFVSTNGGDSYTGPSTIAAHDVEGASVAIIGGGSSTGDNR